MHYCMVVFVMSGLFKILKHDLCMNLNIENLIIECDNWFESLMFVTTVLSKTSTNVIRIFLVPA